MKRLFSIAFFLFVAAFAFSERVTFYTGLSLGATPDMPINMDPFVPVNYALSGGSGSISSISKANGMWKMSVVVVSKETAMPLTYDYYLDVGTKIFMRRLIMPRLTLSLKLVSIDWNRATFEVEPVQ